MKRTTQFFACTAIAGALAMGNACTKESNVAGPTATPTTTVKLTVSPDPLALESGKSKQLTAVATMGDGTKKDVASEAHWASENSQTATVDSKGVVVGVSVGVTTVKTEYGGASASTSVTVTP